MLNYISAEWYKLRHTKGIFIAFGVLLGLILLVYIPKFWYTEPSFGVYATAYIAFLPLGFFLAPIFAVKAFDGQYGKGTMKNEVVFGIPRSRIYLGKMAIAGLTGTGAALIVLNFYLLLNLVGHGAGDENILLYMELCLRGTLLTLPLWLASMSLAFCLQSAFHSSAGAVVADYLILLIGTPLSLMGYEGEVNSLILKFFDRWFFVAPFRSVYGAMSEEILLLNGMSYSWLLGLGWIAVTSLAGMAIFTRKEIS